MLLHKSLLLLAGRSCFCNKILLEIDRQTNSLRASSMSSGAQLVRPIIVCRSLDLVPLHSLRRDLCVGANKPPLSLIYHWPPQIGIGNGPNLNNSRCQIQLSHSCIEFWPVKLARKLSDVGAIGTTRNRLLDPSAPASASSLRRSSLHSESLASGLVLIKPSHRNASMAAHMLCLLLHLH